MRIEEGTVIIQLGQLEMKENTSYRWRIFLQKFDIYLKAAGESGNSDDVSKSFQIVWYRLSDREVVVDAFDHRKV